MSQTTKIGLRNQPCAVRADPSKTPEPGPHSKKDRPSEGQARRFVRLATACREYDTPRSNWYRAFERGELTRYKRGSTVYLDTNEIERWITGDPTPTK